MEYLVAFTVVYSRIVEADSPKEAADMAEGLCPCECEIDGTAYVTCLDTGEHFDDV